MTTAPERELLRRVLPLALPAFVIAYVAGAFVSADVALSAATGVAVVLANFAIHALSMAWAGSVSAVALVAVGLGGFAVRLAAIFVVLLLLSRLAWFSPVAFVAAVVPATVALLAFEARVVSGRLQADLWTFPAASTKARR